MAPRFRSVLLSLATATALAVSGCSVPVVQTTTAEPAPIVTPTPETPVEPEAVPTPEPESTPEPTESPEPTLEGKDGGAVLFERGAQGDKVKDVQARLKQIDWFTEKVSGNYGASTAAAVEGFQAKRGIKPTGKMDEGTMAALRDMTQTPSADELANRPTSGPVVIKQGTTSDSVRNLQARLKQIGHFSGSVTGYYGDTTTASVKSFQARRGLATTGKVDQKTLDRLTSMTKKPTAEQLGTAETEKPKSESEPTKKASPEEKKKATNLDSRCMTGRALCISKKENKMRWVIDGDVKMTVAVRFGTSETPTRNGSFQVGWKSRDHVSSIYKTPMPYAMFFSGGQAVHYSADFAARGYNGGSHGCVNVRDKGAIQSLYNQVRVGDKVIVYR